MVTASILIQFFLFQLSALLSHSLTSCGIFQAIILYQEQIYMCRVFCSGLCCFTQP